MGNQRYLQSVYEELHAHPELPLEEVWTAGFVADELRGMGFSVYTQVGGQGVAGLLDFGGGGSTLALRCDMDALPITEETGADFASQNPGVMHACGHDSHMAMVLAACRYAAQNRERLRGKLLAIFQPAEEVGAGAKAMLEAGLFQRLKPDRLVAVHNLPGLPTGTLGLQSGPLQLIPTDSRSLFRGWGVTGPCRTRLRIPLPWPPPLSRGPWP